MSRVDRFKKGCNHWWVVAITTLVIGGIGLIAVAIIQTQTWPQPYEYGIVFDAGSSHTTMYIYRWSGVYINGTGIVSQIDSCNAPALTSYQGHPDNTGDTLKKCLDKAQSVIPYSKHRQSYIYFGATAGMRLVEKATPTLATVILMSVRHTISTYPFLFTNQTAQARIISGKEEGLFGWITSNYLAGKLHRDRSDSRGVDTVGTLDMGGASTEISFVPGGSVTVPDAEVINITLYGTRYSMYSHSFLCYGVNEAWRRLLAHLVLESGGENVTITNACMPRGNATQATYKEVFEAPCSKDPHAFSSQLLPPPRTHGERNPTYEFVGSSEPNKCKAQVGRLFNWTHCSHPPCSFNGIYQPPVTGKFMAFSAYFYLMNFFNLTSPNTTLDTFDRVITDFCLKNWTEIKHLPTTYTKARDRYCFEAVFMTALLTDGYHFDHDNWATLNFTEKMNGSDIGWSLGFMLTETGSIPEDKPTPPLSTTVFVLLVLVLVAIIAISIGLACYAKSHIPYAYSHI